LIENNFSTSTDDMLWGQSLREKITVDSETRRSIFRSLPIAVMYRVTQKK